MKKDIYFSSLVCFLAGAGFVVLLVTWVLTHVQLFSDGEQQEQYGIEWDDSYSTDTLIYWDVEADSSVSIETSWLIWGGNLIIECDDLGLCDTFVVYLNVAPGESGDDYHIYRRNHIEPEKSTGSKSM
jgi:hypothetical protein